MICKNCLISGGGRKNKFLIENINSFLIDKGIKLQNIDEYQINGDFLESQAFGYLAIRSNLKLPISFPNTTRCKKAITGGVIEKILISIALNIRAVSFLIYLSNVFTKAFSLLEKNGLLLGLNEIQH